MRVVPGKCFCTSFTCFSECSTTLCAQSPLNLEDAKQRKQHGFPTEPPVPDDVSAGDKGLSEGKEESGAFGGGRGEGRTNGEQSERESGGGDGGPAYQADGEESLNARDEVFRKSSLRKPLDSGLPVRGKEQVKWMDFAGRELVEVREFESSELEDSDEDIYMRRCGCIIQ